MVEQGCGAAGGRLRPPVRSWLIAGHGSVAWLLKARPVIDKTPRWRAERRRVLATTRAYCPLTRLLGAPSPRIRGGDKEDRPPRAVTKNRGEDACLARVRSKPAACCLGFLIPPLKGAG